MLSGKGFIKKVQSKKFYSKYRTVHVRYFSHLSNKKTDQ